MLTLLLVSCTFASDPEKALKPLTELVDLVLKGRTLTIPDMSYRDVEQATGGMSFTNTITAQCANSRVTEMSVGTIQVQQQDDQRIVFRLDNVAVTGLAEINYEETDFTYQGQGEFVAKAIKPNHFTVAFSTVEKNDDEGPPIEIDVACTPHNPGFTVEITQNKDESTDPFDNPALKQRLANKVANGMVPFAKTAIASIVCMEIEESLKEVMNQEIKKSFDLVTDDDNLKNLFLQKAPMMLSILIVQTNNNVDEDALRGATISRLHEASIANLANKGRSAATQSTVQRLLRMIEEFERPSRGRELRRP